jgi:hypothetical protein
LASLLLRAIAIHRPVDLESLARRLHLESPILRRTLDDLASEGLVVWNAQILTLTPAGFDAIDRGSAPRSLWRRQAFYFLEPRSDEADPLFLPLRPPRNCQQPPWPNPSPCRPLPHWLEGCIKRPDAWKRACGFPLDVLELVRPDRPSQPPMPDWQTVLVDRLEAWPMAFIQVDQDGDSPDSDAEILGFALHHETWKPCDDAPVLRLASHQRDAVPFLADEPSQHDWEESFCDWGQRCRLSTELLPPLTQVRLVGCRLNVTAPSEVLCKLQPHLCDEPWLLAGAGNVRRAAQLVVPHSEA